MSKNPLSKVDYPLKKSKRLEKALEPGEKTGHVAIMSPKEFLTHANRLKGTKEDKLLISSFKSGMKKGKKFKPLKLLAHNRADGRHRATAAEELGIKEIPVIDYRKSGLKDMKGIHSVPAKATGGALSSTDPNRFMQDILKFSFQILPLIRPGYLKEVPRQGFADGGAPTVGSGQFASIDPSLLVGQSAEPFRGGEEYTDAGGQKIAAPFVKGTSGGYPTYDFSAPPESTGQYSGNLPGDTNPFEPMMQWSWLSKLMGYADGGEVEGDQIEGDVQFAPPEVEQAMRTAQEVAQEPRPFGEEVEKPREAKKEYKPFNVLPFREDESGIHFDPHSGLLGSIISGLTAPGDVLTGKLDPTSDEGIKRAMDVAGLVTGSSAAFERPAGSLASGLSRQMTHDDARLLSMKAILPEGHPLSPKSDELLDLYKTLMEEKIHGDIWLPYMRVAAKKFHKLKREADVTPEHYTETFLQKYLTDPIVKEGTIPTWSEDKTPSTINNQIVNAIRNKSANDLNLQNQIISHELPHIEEFDPVTDSVHRARSFLSSGARNFTGPNMDSLVDKVLAKAPKGFIPRSHEPWSIFSSNVDSFKKPFMNEWARVGGTMAHRRAYAALQDFGPNQGMNFWMGEKPLTQSESIPSQNLQNSLAKLYQETQEHLKDHPKKTVRLYRGIGGHPDEYHPAPVESWTSKRDVAERFGRTMKKDGKYSILTAEVPLESVLMNWKSAEGYWPPEEALKGKEEWTLLGGGLSNGIDVKWK
jgi:hypothetical protein